jgi:hypothetical protein
METQELAQNTAMHSTVVPDLKVPVLNGKSDEALASPTSLATDSSVRSRHAHRLEAVSIWASFNEPRLSRRWTSRPLLLLLFCACLMPLTSTCLGRGRADTLTRSLTVIDSWRRTLDSRRCLGRHGVNRRHEVAKGCADKRCSTDPHIGEAGQRPRRHERRISALDPGDTDEESDLRCVAPLRSVDPVEIVVGIVSGAAHPERVWCVAFVPQNHYPSATRLRYRYCRASASRSKC